mgnify:CR=1 FL=1
MSYRDLDGIYHKEPIKDNLLRAIRIVGIIILSPILIPAMAGLAIVFLSVFLGLGIAWILGDDEAFRSKPESIPMY